MSNFYRVKNILMSLAICTLCFGFPGGVFASDLYSELSGQFMYSEATDISADGSTVVGVYADDGIDGAFSWDTNTDTGGSIGTQFAPTSVSADGSVIVGFQSYSTPRAYRWTSAGLFDLGTIPGAAESVSRALGVSADGSVIVGYSSSSSESTWLYEAFRWTDDGGMVGLGYIGTEGDQVESIAHDVSADGSVVVGYSYYDLDGAPQAFRWTAADGMVGLGSLLSVDAWASTATAVSADGNVVVGNSESDLDGATRAFRWTQAEGMTSLGVLAGDIWSIAADVSATGKVIVGYSDAPAPTESSAFRWTADSGMKSIAELLEADGVDLDGWTLTNAVAVSDDGIVIVGNGRNGGRNGQAWIARLTDIEPDTLADSEGDSDDEPADDTSDDSSGIITLADHNRSLMSVIPVVESAHGLIRELLDVHLLASRHYRGRSGATLNLYGSGFGGKWNSSTVGGTIGIAWNLNDKVRLGGGIFNSVYDEDDLAYSGKYRLESLGGTLWVAYGGEAGGLQLNGVGLLGTLDNKITRGYLNGSNHDSSKGTPDGDIAGILLRCGWKFPVKENLTLTPFATYIWSEVKIDAYSETGGWEPATFDSRKDHADIVKAGLEGEIGISESFSLWGQAAYADRLDDNSTGISGQVLGSTFAVPGYSLDNTWVEADLGAKWQVSQNVSVMLTGGSAFNNDQNPDWRASAGITWSLL